MIFYSAEFEKTIAALLRASDLQHDAYAMLWRYLARAHLGQNGVADGATRVKKRN